MKRLPLALMLAASAVVLAGCGDSDEQQVRQWMNETRQQLRVSVPKLAEPKKFVPFAYDEKASTDPFNPVKLQVALARQQRRFAEFVEGFARGRFGMGRLVIDDAGSDLHVFNLETWWCATVDGCPAMAERL